MRITVLLLIIFTLISCENRKELKIAELYEKANKARVSFEREKAILLYNQIVELDDESSDAYRVLAQLYFESTKYEKALELNQKLIELNPEMYNYYSRTALILEYLGKKEESQKYYSKAREALKQKEEYYWSVTDTLSMAVMLIEVCDSVRGRELIESIIERKINKGFPENELRKIQNNTHNELLNIMKSREEIIDSIELNNFKKNVELNEIIEDRN